MNDNLRYRITAVIASHLFDDEDAEAVADAVIAELRQPQPCRNCGCPLVRDWKVAE